MIADLAVLPVEPAQLGTLTKEQTPRIFQGSVDLIKDTSPTCYAAGLYGQQEIDAVSPHITILHTSMPAFNMLEFLHYGDLVMPCTDLTLLASIGIKASFVRSNGYLAEH